MTEAQQRKVDNQWTSDTLFEHFDRILSEKDKLLGEKDRRYEQMFKDQERATNLALAAAQLAVTKAEVATEKRFDSTNEFRKTLSDQTAGFVTRREMLAFIVALSAVIGTVFLFHK
jgi:hypothetical protein